jgi:hypothetical protein
VSQRRAADTSGRTLASYVRELVARLGEGDPAALHRLRTIVGPRRARIGLERETIEVRFDDVGRLVVREVEPVAAGALGPDLDGEGHTAHQVVLDLLAGTREVTDAILDGDIEVQGDDASVAALLAAVDILIDVATRVPALRELAEDYVAAHAAHRAPPGTRARRTAWPPRIVDPLEDQLLAELGLRPDG